MSSNDTSLSRVFHNSRNEPENDPTPGLAFRTIRDLSQLQEFKTFWDSCPGTVESDFDYFANTVSSDNCRQPHIIVLLENGRPDALLIGMRARRKVPFTLGYLTVLSLEADVLEFVYGCLRGNASARNCAGLTREVMRSLDEGVADFAVWKQLDRESPLYDNALRLPRFVLRDHSHSPDEHWFMTMPKGPEELRAIRARIKRRCQKFITRLSRVSLIRCFHSPADMEVAISDMEEIASKTDKRLFGVGFFDNAETRKQMVAAAEKGWLRVYLLYVAGKPAAFWTGTLHNRCLQPANVGYDPAFSRFSPGVFLFLGIIDDLWGTDVETLDLGWGINQLNQSFGDLRQVESEVHIYAPTPRGILTNSLSTAIHRGDALIRRVHWLDGARKALRDYALRRRRNQRLIVAGSRGFSRPAQPVPASREE